MRLPRLSSGNLISFIHKRQIKRNYQIYVALSDKITESKCVSKTELTHAIVRQKSPRFTLHNSTHIFLDTKKKILEYLEEQEEVLLNNKRVGKEYKKTYKL